MSVQNYVLQHTIVKTITTTQNSFRKIEKKKLAFNIDIRI